MEKIPVVYRTDEFGSPTIVVEYPDGQFVTGFDSLESAVEDSFKEGYLHVVVKGEK